LAELVLDRASIPSASREVRLALHETELQFESRPMDLARSDRRAPRHRSRALYRARRRDRAGRGSMRAGPSHGAVVIGPFA
jgi:hypothetical protein